MTTHNHYPSTAIADLRHDDQSSAGIIYRDAFLPDSLEALSPQKHGGATPLDPDHTMVAGISYGQYVTDVMRELIGELNVPASTKDAVFKESQELLMTRCAHSEKALQRLRAAMQERPADDDMKEIIALAGPGLASIEELKALVDEYPEIISAEFGNFVCPGDARKLERAAMHYAWHVSRLFGVRPTELIPLMVPDKGLKEYVPNTGAVIVKNRIAGDGSVQAVLKRTYLLGDPGPYPLSVSGYLRTADYRARKPTAERDDTRPVADGVALAGLKRAVEQS